MGIGGDETAVRRAVMTVNDGVGMHTIGPTATTGHRLTLEWARLRNRRSALLHAAGWGLIEAPLSDLDQVLVAVGFENRSPSAERDLHTLVTIARDDELAARVVLQRILPGLLAVVRRRRRGGHGESAFDELLTTAWISIRTYNTRRTPSCLAAALISDADYRAFRSAGRRRSATERPVDIDDTFPAHREPPCAADELDEVLDDALAAGVPEEDIDLLRRLVAAPRAIDVAAQLQVTPRTIRNRRDRITGRLREVAVAA